MLDEQIKSDNGLKVLENLLNAVRNP